MNELVAPELLTMGISATAGFLMRYIAKKDELANNYLRRELAKQTGNDGSADAAAKRIGNAGIWIRRLIVVAVLYALIIHPAWMAGQPEGVTVLTEKRGFLGLFKQQVWQTLNGFVILPELRHAILAIISFYFGNACND